MHGKKTLLKAKRMLEETRDEPSYLQISPSEEALKHLLILLD
jgi:hypothetical protein